MDLYDWMLLGYVLFITLNVVDLFITKVILDNGGKEWNFVARFFYNHLGIKGIACLKSVILIWFGIQYYFKVLDLFTIYYLNFMFFVVLIFMYRDAVEAGLKSKLNPVHLFSKDKL